ncbi:MAG TPA: prephenate dehydratase domain-containing protein [Polyangiaceae bacterium]
MSDHKREIEELRAELARVDGQILTALEKRANASRRAAELRAGPAQLPLTEKAQLTALLSRASGDMPASDLRAIFQQIYASCLALELPVKVSYIGPEGGFAHAAARARFGASAQLSATETIAETLEEVAQHRAEFCVLPVETTTEGPVQATIFALVATDLKIVAEVEAVSDLCLMNRTGNENDIEKVYATAADHARAQKALTALGKKPAGGAAAQTVTIYDVKTPLVACKLAAEDHGAAALVTDGFGAEHDLQIARRGLVDDGAERVRYAIIGARPSARTGDDSTACVFSVHDAPGALLDILRLFAERGINLRKIQSRPDSSPHAGSPAHPGDPAEWTYMFFVELSGHTTDRPLVSALEDVRHKARFFKVLGSYPSI